MSYTTAELETLFANANIGEAAGAATQLLLASYASQTTGGSLTDAQALVDALHIPPPADGSVGEDTPEDSTDVALAVYQFFTGMAPTMAGLAFLVHGGDNPNDLDSAYYAGFNQANRYYNFAINLITGNPMAAANFVSAYGSASFNQAVASAYESIVGSAVVGSAAATAAIAAIEAQQPYFAALAAHIAPAVNPDQATKAIAIAYILEEAVKADVGVYAYAIDQFDIALAKGAPIPGETAGGIDLLTAYPLPPPEPVALNTNLGNASVTVHGSAATGFVDLFAGGSGTDTIYGTVNGGDTNVSLGTSPGPGPGDSVFLYTGSHNRVSIGDGNESSVNDASNGADTITLGDGAGDTVVLSGSGASVVTLGDGAGDTVEAAGKGADTLHLGAGAGDSVSLGAGRDIVFLGAGSGDVVAFASGIANVSFAGPAATADLSTVTTASFATPTTASQAQVLTNNLNVITGFTAGDKIVLPAADAVVVGHNLAGSDGQAVLASGTYDPLGGDFAYGATGHDALLTYDAGGGALVSVVLVGGAAEMAHASVIGDVITF